MIRQLVKFSVMRKVTIFMVALGVLAFGLVGFSRLPINLLPALSYPSFTIQTNFDNAAPAEVEQLISRPVEEVVGVLRGLKQVHSVSRSGVSEVTLSFAWDANLSELAMDIREKLDRLVLPLEAESPIVLRYDPALDPVVKLSFSGELSLAELRLLAEKQVKESLERIEGVASTQVQGGEEEEIHINIDQGKLAAMGISPQALGQLLADSNINRPGGSLKNSQTQLLVRTLNEYDSIDEIRQLRITPSESAAVSLGEVASVEWASKDREEIARFNGQEGVMLSIFKEGDANTVEVAGLIKQKLAELNATLPGKSRLRLEFDQSRFIERAIDEVKQSLLVGGLLAILVLWLFLRDFKLTAIITTAIPVSVVATFIFMYRGDVSLNIMSLGGLTLGVGMLVDSAIVVLESIYRQKQLGLSSTAAAVTGTSKVGSAVIASVLTTIAVFVPIVFVEGIAGQLFFDQAMTVTFSLMASLLVSFTLVPMLAGLGQSAPPSPKVTAQNAKPVIADPWYLSAYRPVLTWGLKHPWLTLVLAFSALALCLPLVPRLPTALIPSLSEGEFFFDLQLPEGTSLPTTEQLLLGMEQIALAHPDVERVYTAVGTRNASGGLSLKTRDENLGQLNVVIKDRANSEVELRVIEDLRQAFAKLPQAEVQFGRPSFFSLKKPLELVFYSENIEKLGEVSSDYMQLLEQIEGLTDLQASFETGNPELKIEFDRQKLAQLGFSIDSVSQSLQHRVSGSIVSRFQKPDRQVDIRLRNRFEDRSSVNDIENMVIGESMGRPVTLAAVAKVVSSQGPAAIDRLQQSRVAIIAANLSGVSLSEVSQSISQLVERHGLPEGVSFEFAGQNEEMQKSIDSLIFAVLLAVFLVYLVMAATFEHLGHPFIILLTIPLSLIGVILGLYTSGYAISVISMIGAVFLVGVVVNNAIVLVDAINQERQQGLDKLEAIMTAAQNRLRPILMTTLTTVLGLMPMAIGFGEGAELRAPLAIVVSWGLVFATGLTLLVIPAAYLVMPSQVASDLERLQLEEALHQAEAIELENPFTQDTAPDLAVKQS